jgi:cysteine desulfurase/selenocysteine lyase
MDSGARHSIFFNKANHHPDRNPSCEDVTGSQIAELILTNLLSPCVSVGSDVGGAERPESSGAQLLHRHTRMTFTASQPPESVRSDFPILSQEINGHPLIYFDNAATTQKPRAVLDALMHYYERDNANVHRGIHTLSSRATEAFENARGKVSRFLGAHSPNEIIFTRGTTEAVNLVANAWGGAFLKAGDVILLTEMEHHSNLVPWQLIAQRTGARLRFIPVSDGGELNLEGIDGLLNAEVKLISLTHISNFLGTINPVRELCSKARAVGAVSLVDAAQSAGHMPLDVKEIGCDFLAFSGHKMCAPTGIGVLYGREAILESTPPWHGGGEMILSVRYESSTYKGPPAKFEAGTPNIAGAIALGAAIDYLQVIGREFIRTHDEGLALLAFEKILNLPNYRPLGPSKTRGGLVSFVHDSIHPHDLTAFCDQKGLALRGGHHCNQPLMRKFGFPSTSRASFYLYNTEAEVNRMIEILDEANHFFK